jgi:hypothetical protein
MTHPLQKRKTTLYLKKARSCANRVGLICDLQTCNMEVSASNLGTDIKPSHDVTLLSPVHATKASRRSRGTVIFSSTLVNNQLDALFQCIYLFHFSTCFEQPSAELHQYIIWYVSLCVGDCLVCRYNGIPDTYTQRYIPDDILIQLVLLMMSTGLLESCREVK